MEVRLKVLSGKHAGKKIPIRGPKFLIGRADDCHLRAGSDLVSRHHCAIVLGEAYLGVREFGSRNGTFVNQVAVKGEVELHSGDHLKIGPLEFEVVVRQSKGEVQAEPEHAGGEQYSADIGTVQDLAAGGDTEVEPPSPTEGQQPEPEAPGGPIVIPQGETKTPERKPFRVEMPQTKDSREAAANILKRLGTRRR